MYKRQGYDYTPFASLSERFLQNSVTCVSLSKAFKDVYKRQTLYTLILGLFSIGWTDCPEDFMERMQRPGHSDIQLDVYKRQVQQGQLIEHERFGLGEVLKVEGEGDNAKANIRFKNAGDKQLLLSFARFKVLS